MYIVRIKPAVRFVRIAVETSGSSKNMDSTGLLGEVSSGAARVARALLP